MTVSDNRIVSIRPARLDDLAAITAIYADAVLHGTASYELEPPSLAQMTSRFQALVAEEFPYLVAESGTHILGYAYAGPFRPRLAYRFMLEDSVYIAPHAKGQGIGTRLLETLIVEATRLGFRQMAAVIGDGYPANASVRLHVRLGFRHSGRLEGAGYKHGRWLDTVFMQRSLNAGTASPPDPASLPERSFRLRQA